MNNFIMTRPIIDLGFQSKSIVKTIIDQCFKPKSIVKAIIDLDLQTKHFVKLIISLGFQLPGQVIFWFPILSSSKSSLLIQIELHPGK